MNEAPPLPGNSPAPPISYRDRQTGLVLFGIAEILLGALCLLMSAMTALAQLALPHGTGTSMPRGWLILSVLFYLFIAIGLIWLGIGSIQCRRWARSLLLILSWLWLGTGVLTVPMMVWMLPRILSKPPPGGQPLPQEAMIVIVAVQIVFSVVFFILLPGALVLFYRSPHVKRTCEARDPQPRWTDACPLPVLAVACLTGFGSAMMVVMVLSGLAVFPFFGAFLTGWIGSILMMGSAVLFFWIGRCWYRLEPGGWWALLGTMVVFCISNLLTFARTDIIELYEKLGYTQDMINLIRQYNWMEGRTMIWMTIVWVVPMLGYLLWTKRYFPKAGPQAQRDSGSSIGAV